MNHLGGRCESFVEASSVLLTLSWPELTDFLPLPSPFPLPLHSIINTPFPLTFVVTTGAVGGGAELQVAT